MNMRERLTRAIYDKATRFDGDEIAVHLGNSMMIEGSAVDVDELQRIVMQVCEDAADAVLDELMTPTEGMMMEGIHAEAFRSLGALKVNRVWQDMIKAAKDGK